VVALQTTWSWLPAIYLFLGGLAAGAFLTTSILRLAKPDRYKKTVTGGVWIAVAALGIGLLALVSEVEKPFQAMVLFNSFVNGSSWMTIGAWLLFATFIVYVLSALFTTDLTVSWLSKLSKFFIDARPVVNKSLAIIGIPLSLAVAIYTGVLLGAAPYIPLWNTWLLPVLFTVSAIDTGIAAVTIVMVLSEKEEGKGSVHTVLEFLVVCLVAIEAVVLVVYLMSMQGGGIGQVISAEIMLTGSLMVPFWLLVVIIGLAIPFILALIQVIISRARDNKKMVVAIPVLGAVCALIGGFALRYVILAAGVHDPLVSPAFKQAVDGVLFFIS